MTRRLDPQFASYVAAMDRAMSMDEVWEARRAAEAIARECGFASFNEAMAELRRPTSSIAVPENEAEEEPDIDDRAECSHLRSSKPQLSEPDLANTDLSHMSTRDEMIVAALAADPSRSDRDIAREAGCSPTHVGKARAAAGLARQVRVVRRGGRSYEMKIAAATATSGEAS